MCCSELGRRSLAGLGLGTGHLDSDDSIEGRFGDRCSDDHAAGTWARPLPDRSRTGCLCGTVADDSSTCERCGWLFRRFSAGLLYRCLLAASPWLYPHVRRRDVPRHDLDDACWGQDVDWFHDLEVDVQAGASPLPGGSRSAPSRWDDAHGVSPDRVRVRRVSRLRVRCVGAPDSVRDRSRRLLRTESCVRRGPRRQRRDSITGLPT